MKIKLSKSFFIGLCALLLMANPLWAMDKIIAIVNDELITQSDLDEYLQMTFAGVVSSGGYSEDDLEKIRLDLEINGLQNLIEDKLILSRAKEKDLQVNERLVDERIEEIKARYPDEETFLTALSMKGVSISDIRTKIRNQLMLKFIVGNEVRSKIYVNPHEVTRYYDENLTNFNKSERLDLDSIFISFEDDKDAALIKAQEAVKEIEEGGEFNKVRDEYSDASSIGIVERGQLMKKIEDIIFELEESDVSEIVEVESGAYIFKLNERFAAETAPIDDVKDKIYNMLFNQKFEEAFAEWIDELKNEAYIEIKD